MKMETPKKHEDRSGCQSGALQRRLRTAAAAMAQQGFCVLVDGLFCEMQGSGSEDCEDCLYQWLETGAVEGFDANEIVGGKGHAGFEGAPDQPGG